MQHFFMRVELELLYSIRFNLLPPKTSGNTHTNNSVNLLCRNLSFVINACGRCSVPHGFNAQETYPPVTEFQWANISETSTESQWNKQDTQYSNEMERKFSVYGRNERETMFNQLWTESTVGKAASVSSRKDFHFRSHVNPFGVRKAIRFGAEQLYRRAVSLSVFQIFSCNCSYVKIVFLRYVRFIEITSRAENRNMFISNCNCKGCIFEIFIMISQGYCLNIFGKISIIK